MIAAPEPAPRLGETMTTASPSAPFASLAGLTECVQPQLAEVERLFHRELESDLACVNVLIKHVSRFRGKMLRPLLVLLSGRACAPAGAELGEAHVMLATVVEMVH